MRTQKYIRGSVAIFPMALLALSCSAVYADTLDENVYIGTSGGGFIYVDETEDVVAPGIKAVTFVKTRIAEGNDPTNFGPAVQNPVIDFTALPNRGSVSNCLMAKNDFVCDSAPGSGKRIKNHLTGMDAFDTRLRTSKKIYTSDVDSSVINTDKVDYFTFGKMSNYTGARMTGFDLQLLDKDGNLMDETDPANAVLFNTAATGIGFGSGLTSGLFGDGGQEGGDIGFFSTDKVIFSLDKDSKNWLKFDGLTSASDDYSKFFGTGYLDDSQVPDGLTLFEAGADMDADEGNLIAWHNVSKDEWLYGNLGDVILPERLQYLAEALGVDVADLGYVAGGKIPDEILAKANATGDRFLIQPVEDLRNANLNYTMTIGSIEGGEFTVRLTPKFAALVAGATTESQLKNAIYLDMMAEIPYLNTVEGSAEDYQAAIASLLAGENANDTARALESIGFGYATAFTSIGFEAARDQVAAIIRYVPWNSLNGNQEAAANEPGSWAMGSGLYGFASQSGSRSEYDPLSNVLGYDVDVYSLTAGIEKRLTGTNSSLGLAVGYTDATAETYQDLGKIDADGYSVSAFTRTRFGEGGLVQALVGYQDLSYESGRTAFDGSTANGETDGTQKFAALSVDYLKDMGSFKIGPTASVEYYNVKSDSFTETGSDGWNLNVNEQSSDVVLASIGARGEYGMNNNNTRLMGSVKYTNASGDDLNIQTGLVGQTALAPYTVKGMEEDLVDVSIGLDHVVLSNAATKVALYGGYNGSFGSDYESQGIQIGLNTTF